MLIPTAILLFILIVAATWWFGLWSNLITLVNLLISSMVASSIYEPISTELEKVNGSYRLLCDFIAVWLVFIITFAVIRGLTDFLSGYRLKFDNITELVGRSILSVWIACVFICFSFFTLQLAPIQQSEYGNYESFDKGTIPDRMWLAFIQSRSRGALSASKTSWPWPEYKLPPHPDDVDLDARVFDPHAEFLKINAARRKSLAKLPKLRVNN